FLAVRIDALYECIQIRGIAFASEFDLEGSAIGGVFVSVDGVAHLPEVVAQLAFFFALDAHARQGQRPGGENDKNRSRNDQFDQRESAKRPSARLPCRLSPDHVLNLSTTHNKASPQSYY